MAARSFGAPLIAILNLRGRNENSGMQRRPLPDDFRPGPRILDLVRRNPGELVGRGIADAVAAGLDGVHFGGGQVVQNIRRILQPYPVELDVLAGGEMAVAAVIPPGDPRQGAHLVGTQQAIGNGDPQHVGMELQVKAVAKPERLELILGKLARNPPGDLAAKLRGAFANQRFIEGIVGVHDRSLRLDEGNGRAIGPDAFPQARRHRAAALRFDFHLIDTDDPAACFVQPRGVQIFGQLPLGHEDGGIGDIPRPVSCRATPDNRAIP